MSVTTGLQVVLTRAELDVIAADRVAELHYAGWCWCGEAHDGNDARLVRSPLALREGAA